MSTKHDFVLEQARARSHAQNVEWLRGVHPDSAIEIAEASKSAWGREYLEKHAAERLAEAAKAHAPATSAPDEMIVPVSKAALEHNANVMKVRRDAFTAYVTKVATERKVSVAQASEDLANSRDPEYTQLWKRVSEALHAPSQQLAAGIGGAHASYAAFDAQKNARRQAETMKQATAEAEKMARMTTSELELYKRASAVATAKKIDIQAAQGELLETSSEARALYKRIPFEKTNR